MKMKFKNNIFILSSIIFTLFFSQITFATSTNNHSDKPKESLKIYIDAFYTEDGVEVESPFGLSDDDHGYYIEYTNNYIDFNGQETITFNPDTIQYINKDTEISPKATPCPQCDYGVYRGTSIFTADGYDRDGDHYKVRETKNYCSYYGEHLEVYNAPYCCSNRNHS